jgi:hypothetical protein
LVEEEINGDEYSTLSIVAFAPDTLPSINMPHASKLPPAPK